ncbi:unnamed protein product [Schistosoma turkestanicum]|nr:unnamed protein product [Schistosoma turkestanicum]
MNTSTKQYIIGIAGASNSGKTTITGKLATYLQSIGYTVTCLQMDDYYWPYHDKRHVRDPMTNQPNFDCESAINWEGIISFIKLWCEPQVSEKKNRILLIEGILIMNKMELRKIMNLRIFLKITYEDLLQRRKLRKYRTPSPPDYIDKYVWPAYVRTLDMLKYSKDSIYYFDSKNGTETLFREICQCVNEKIGFTNE